ncbi:MAG: alpha-amylase family glycosyl hydrolase [Bacteroidota bacterium]
MNNTTAAKKTTHMGAFPAEKGFAFRTWAPHAKSVTVMGSFCDWDEDKYSMEAEDNGHWFIEVPEAKNGDQYLFVVETENGEKLKKADPYARRQENSVGNSIIYADDFDWEKNDFEIADWNQLVIYELHIGTFHREDGQAVGTFQSAAEKLPHLKELGVNAVELLPVNEFAGDHSWGYNPAFPYAVEEAYGHPDDFKNFVKQAHEHGIAVILDVVYNHFGPSDLSMWSFDGWSENEGGGIYFYNDWRASTPWGDTRPDYGRREVRDYIFHNAMMWLEEYRCDGLRFDAVSYIRNVKGGENEGDNLTEGYELLQRINDAVQKRFPKKIMIAEDTDCKDFVTNKTYIDGIGFGAQWDINFAHEVRSVLLERDDANRNIGAVAAALSRQVSGDAFKRVVFTESHDEVANGESRVAAEVSEDAEEVDNFYSKKLSTLGGVVTMTTAGIPMLFQGQELLEDKWFCDQDPIEWERKEQFSGIFKMYQDLIRLRTNQSSMTKGLLGRQTEIFHYNEQAKVIAYVRWYDDKAKDGVVVILNFSSQAYDDYCLKMPAQGKYELEFNSHWEGYEADFGDYEVTSVMADEHREVCVNLPEYTGLIFCRVD